MGLDAVVYRNMNHLELETGQESAHVIPETGEICFDNAELSQKYKRYAYAAEFRLGNASEISALRQEVTHLTGPDSIILQRILYSGTHSGDSIPLSSIAALSLEPSAISSGPQSPELQSLVSSLNTLVHAAQDEGNPIVFE